MADIELVIKMAQESYNNLKTGCTQRVSDGEMIEALKNGIPLPKGHGRLIDADTYRKEMLDSREFDFFKRLDMQPTIIEADNGESEE